MYDITKSDPKELEKKFSIIHDKGTYDAISLNPNNSKLHRELYIEKVTQMLEDNGNYSFNPICTTLIMTFTGRLWV